MFTEKGAGNLIPFSSFPSRRLALLLPYLTQLQPLLK